MVETDAFNLVIMVVLSQYDNDGIVIPVAYFSRKYSLVEIYYKIYNEELILIVCAFKE
jgi:hypothetical protein